MKKNNDIKAVKKSIGRVPASSHKWGYKPVGLETSSGLKLPNVGSSVNKHKKQK